MKVHFIAIGGSAMHNLAIALHLKGYEVTGSDDEIFSPSKDRLEKYNLLPDNIGWDASKITENIDAVILGMHARKDNPELLKAQKLKLKIYSYPEYLYEQTKDKTRIVIGGSHGKTSITSMILHVLNQLNIPHDYMVGAQLEGFECMVSLTKEAKIAVLEGDEYLSSPIDRRPKFHLYQPNIALISGIAWDHINVFPTIENYINQFKIFVEKIQNNGTLIYCNLDENVKEVALSYTNNIEKIGYGEHIHEIKNGKTFLIHNGEKTEINIFGSHNLQNLNGALEVCKTLGVAKEDFYNAISSFGGASKRLELVKETSTSVCYKDFAHSPSKLKATTEALKNQFPDRKLLACMELHTFSSLNKEFLQQYDGSMSQADIAIVFFNPKTLKHKRLEEITASDVKEAFGSDQLIVIKNKENLLSKLRSFNYSNTNLLMMSSGTFSGIDLEALADEIL